MFDQRKYILNFAALVFCTLAVFSCKSKKEASSAKEVSGDSGLHGELREVRFGYHFVSGCSERMKGNLQEAMKNFEECKNIDPTNAPVRYELGMIYKLLGENDKAISNARYCAESDPRNEWYQLLLIECYNSVRLYHQAIRVREALLRNFPFRSEFKEDLAIEYAMAGQYEKSFKIYDELEKTYGVNEQITMNKVKLLKSQKKFRDAEAELLKLSATDKNEPKYYSYLAEFYIEKNEPEKAKGIYDKILKTDPENAATHIALYDYYETKGNDAVAFGHLKRAFQNPELDLNAKISIAGTFYKKAEAQSKVDMEQGTELAKIILKVHPEAPAPNALYADFLLLENKTQEAARYYYLASRNEKQNYKIWQNLMFVNNELGQFDSLQKVSAQVMELFPAQPECYLYNGVANMQLENYQKAAQSIKDGFGLANDNHQKLDFLKVLGDAYHHLKDFQNSDKAFDEALKIDPDNAYVLNNYAYYLSVRNENLDKAEKLSERSNLLKPGDRSYMDTFGWILFQQKRYQEAEAWLAKAAGEGPKNAVILEHYGDVLFKLNKLDEALLQWTAAKLAGGNSPELLNKIKNKKIE